jgi:hypothetical protein
LSFSKENIIKTLDDQFLRLAELAEKDNLTVDEHCHIAEAMCSIVNTETHIANNDNMGSVMREMRNVLSRK